MKKSLMSKLALSTAGLALVFGLAGCGQKSGASSDSNSAKSAKVTESAADKAYKKANDLISKGQYQKAYDLLDDVENENKKVEYLEDDLDSYLEARADYNKGDYQEAEAELPGMKSSSKPMKKAYKALRVKISKAINGEIENSSTKQTKQNSSSQASSSSQRAANADAAKATNEDVVTNFANKMGFNKKGYGIIPVSKNGNTYRFEVRQNNADNSVANMIGIYEYNATTGTATKIN
ncbi:hypothetical protein [uncultured Limosilactobacillus sp.]|uniref:hypothetical protein n=1 Tax=uncultured Limosilactobacillus sp. TaxID=2837629 RepID=UPI0025D2EA63|nr:hypothetical protein [uncultured Limosilactobacillus sp.]